MGMQHRVGRATIEINFGFVLVIISVLCFGSHLQMNLYDFHRKEVIQRESSQRLYFFILTVLICEHIISAMFLLIRSCFLSSSPPKISLPPAKPEAPSFHLI